jgi:alkylhydroperoxidase/carboxymuconolactone decarboxylase family protein YurZ
MAIDLVNLPSVILRRYNTEAGTNFRAMREALVKAGPLDAKICELIIIASFATVGFEDSFKSHALRALKAGISKGEIEHAVLVILGATAALATVTNALGWIDDADTQFKNGE